MSKSRKQIILEVIEDIEEHDPIYVRDLIRHMLSDFEIVHAKALDGVPDVPRYDARKPDAFSYRLGGGPQEYMNLGWEAAKKKVYG